MCASRAEERIAGALRLRVARAGFSSGRGRAVSDPAALAEESLALVDQVAEQVSQQTPLRQSAPVLMAIIFVVTVWVHWPAAIILALATAMLPLNMWLAGRLAQDGNDRYLHALESLGAVVLDSFRGIATLRRLGAVQRRADTIERASLQLQRANLAVLQRAFISGVVMDTVVTLSIAVSATYIGMTLLGYVHVPGTPTLDLGHGLFVLLLCPMYFTPMRMAAAGFHDRERSAASARRIAAREAAASKVPASSSSAAAVADLRSVTLDASRIPIVDDVVVDVAGPLTAPAGQWTAVVGPSGAGKSTLLAVVSGQIPSTAVHWVGQAGEDSPWPGGATWIGQGTVLITGTLAENLRLGAPSATEGELRDALRVVGLEPLLAVLPDGLETLCGPRGYPFSAGEARRVAIARAILRGSKLWLLDEPTAHLDAQTEASVVDALVSATRGCTVVCVTHSAAVAALASTRWAVDSGRVSQEQAVSR